MLTTFLLLQFPIQCMKYIPSVMHTVWAFFCFIVAIDVNPFPWTRWRHQMETFSALLAICAGNSPVSGEFPPQRPVTRSFDVFFDLRLNKPLSTQWWGWWFETLSHPLWRHCNENIPLNITDKVEELETWHRNTLNRREKTMFSATKGW